MHSISSAARVEYESQNGIVHWHITWSDFESAKTAIPLFGTKILVHLGKTIIDRCLKSHCALVLSTDYVRGMETTLRALRLEMNKDVFLTNIYPFKDIYVRSDDLGWFFPRVPDCIYDLDIYQALIEDAVLLLLDYTGPNDLILSDELNESQNPGFAVANILLDYCSMLIAAGDDGYGIQVWMREGSSV